MRFSLNVSVFFPDRDLLESISETAKYDFTTLECWYPYGHEPSEINRALSTQGLDMHMINSFPGNDETDRRGLSGDPDNHETFRKNFDKSLRFALELGCSNLHVLSGPRLDRYSLEEQEDTVITNLEWASSQVSGTGITLLLEALNTLDKPDRLIQSSSRALEIVGALDSERVKFMYDIYHMQLMEGNLINTMIQNLDRIGHIQFANVPGRHGPGTGEIFLPKIIAALEDHHYSGYVGLEYEPLQLSEDHFAWMEEI